MVGINIWKRCSLRLSERISERTKAGLESARRKGIPLGRRRVRVDVDRLRQLRAEGRSYEQITKGLKCSVGTAFRASKMAA